MSDRAKQPGRVVDDQRSTPASESAERQVLTLDEIVEEVLCAQADLQMALGVLRLDRADGNYSNEHAEFIENWLSKSLARSHRLLDRLGRPMYQPATHPEIPDA